MSWLEKIKKDFVITTGDGLKYRPSWLNAKKLKEYNVAEFDFPNQPGTLVKRGMPLGRKFALELYFQGEEHLDEAEAFERSADDTRPWTIDHPYYGTIIVHPTSLDFDNSVLNVTKITGTVIETITDTRPRTKVDPIDAINITKISTDEYLVNTITAKITPTDLNTMSVTNSRNYKFAVKIITLPEEFEVFHNAFNVAEAAINNAIASPLIAIRAVNNVITLPALFTIDVKARVQLFADEFEGLRTGLANILSLSAKQFYQNAGGVMISSVCQAAANPLEGDYTNGKSALSTIETIQEMYDQYLEDLDGLQTATGGLVTSFIPDAQALIELNNLVNTTISSLFTIALNSKSERSIITEYDTNIIILAHRLYGLDELDANIDELIANNDFGLNDLLQIKKGTKVVYYI